MAMVIIRPHEHARCRTCHSYDPSHPQSPLDDTRTPARINYKTIGDDAMPLSIATMQRKITGFHLDEEGHWVAELECGHNQHVRHDPPYVERPWVITEHGRRSRLGQELNCVRCDEDRCATTGRGPALAGSQGNSPDRRCSARVRPAAHEVSESDLGRRAAG